MWFFHSPAPARAGPAPPYRPGRPLTAVRFGATRSGQPDKTLARPDAARDRRQVRRHGSSPPAAQRHRAHLRRHPAADRGRIVGVDRRARLAGRPQRLGQVDAAEDRRRPGRARPRHGVRAAGRDGALSAAGAGFLRLCDHAGLCRSRPGGERRPACRALHAGAARPQRRGRPGACLRRRSAPRVARPRAGALARHPAAGRADQPSRPHHHRMAGARARSAAAPRWSSSATTGAFSPT